MISRKLLSMLKKQTLTVLRFIWLKGASTKKRKKGGKKDPNAPKRGLSSYMFFSGEERKKQKEAHPEYV